MNIPQVEIIAINTSDEEKAKTFEILLNFLLTKPPRILEKYPEVGDMIEQMEWRIKKLWEKEVREFLYGLPEMHFDNSPWGFGEITFAKEDT